MIRAKFIVQQISRSTYGHSVRLQPVSGDGSAEDHSFWLATPAGQIEMSGLKRETVDLFGEPGTEFYVDFTPPHRTSGETLGS